MGNIDIKRFDNWQSWLYYTCEKAHDTANADMGQASRREGEREWYGTDNFANAEALARKGWREGAKHVEAFQAVLTERIVGRIEKEDVAFDTEGAGFDVGRMLTGEPEHWVRWETLNDAAVAPANRCVHIIMNGTVHCGVDRRTIIARGAAVAALAALLEYAGYNVRLDVVHASGWRTMHAYVIRIKDYGQPVDAGTLAFAVAHPSSLRRLAFSAMEHETREEREANGYQNMGGYGSPGDLPPAEREGAIYVAAGSVNNHGSWEDSNAAEAWVLDQLAEHGIRLVDRDGQ